MTTMSGLAVQEGVAEREDKVEGEEGTAGQILLVRSKKVRAALDA